MKWKKTHAAHRYEAAQRETRIYIKDCTAQAGGAHYHQEHHDWCMKAAS